jgi:hypothetical protein
MALDYQLERKVAFSDKSEYASLYKWFLYETDEAGKVGRAYIPWSWGINFTALSIELNEELAVSRYGEEKEKPVARTHISATLRPGYANEDSDAPTFSMFGTKRLIESFNLIIYENTEPEKGERCALWGSPMYDAGDLRREVMDDTLQITLFVSPERFARYVDMVRHHPPTLVSLRLSGALGMYSEWTPDVRTGHVKVLTNLKDHGLTMPEGATITPPVVGEVAEYALHFYTKRECYTPPRSVERSGDEEIAALLEDQKLSPAEESVTLQRKALKLALENARRLKHLTYSVWVVAFVVVIWALRGFGK